MKTVNLLIFSLLSLVTSCKKEAAVVQSNYPDGSPQRVTVYKGTGASREPIKETTYYTGNRMQMQGTFRKGKREGKWVSWYENGKIWSEGYFSNGKGNGKRITYFENGRIRYVGEYKDDERTGEWRYYDENGKLLREIDYSAVPKK
jgi:hypothetical protein